jgi:hypothetical protein
MLGKKAKKNFFSIENYLNLLYYICNSLRDKREHRETILCILPIFFLIPQNPFSPSLPSAFSTVRLNFSSTPEPHFSAFSRYARASSYRLPI